MIRNSLALLAFGALCLPGYVAGMECPALPDAKFRTAFVQAERSPPNGRSARERLQARIGEYALYPYVELARLKGKFPNVPTSDVESFLSRYGAQPMTRLLQRRWLRRLAGRGTWHEFIEWYPEDSPVDLQCQLCACAARDR